MPTIPVYNREVSLQPQFTQGIDVRATPEAFGADIGRGMQDIGQGISQIAQAKFTLQQKLAENEARNGQIAAMGMRNTVLLDPDNGLLNRSGVNAQGSAKAWEAEAQRIRAEVTKGMSPAAAAIFNRNFDEEVVRTAGTVLTHEAGQLKQGLDDSYVALADSYAESAVTYLNDPTASRGAIDSGIGVIRERAATMGWDPAKTDNAIAQYVSDTHKQIAMTIAATDPLAAQAYVDANREEMTAEGSNYQAVTAVLKEAVTLAQADQAASGFFTGGGGGGKGAAVDSAEAFLNRLGGTESSNIDTASNDAVGSSGRVGHYGRIQFGLDRLDEVKAAGVIPESMTPEAFLASPDAQRRAELWHIADIDKHIKAKGYLEMGYSLDGLRAVAHLGGKTGLDNFIATKGGYDPADANGTKLSQYYAKFSGAGGANDGFMDPAAIEAYIATLPQDVQQMTRTKIYGYYENIGKAEAANRSRAKQVIWDTILQSGELPSDPAILSAAGMEAVSAAQTYIEKGGAPSTTNEEIYRQLTELKANQRQNFVKVDLNDYRQHLTPEDFAALQKDQRGMLEQGAAQLDYKVAHDLSKQVVEAQIGPAPSTSDADKRMEYDARLNALYRAVEADMRAFQQANKVVPLYDDILKMVTARTLPTISAKDEWGTDPTGMQFEMFDTRSGTIMKLDAEAIVPTIPLDIYNMIVADLKAQGVEQTPEEIASAYEEFLLWGTVDSTDEPQTYRNEFGGGR